MKFKDQIIVVTGGARGIGKTMVKAFAKEEGQVIFCDINKEQGLRTKEQFLKEGLKVDFLHADLSQKGEPQSVIQKVVSDFGKIDVLVNNARSGRRTDLLLETEESWEETLSVTLKAAFFLSQEAIRWMAKGKGGRIVNISSLSAQWVSHESVSYHIAKAGLLQMTRYLAANAGKQGIRVNAVLPGFIVQEEHQERFEKADNQRYRKTAYSCHPNTTLGSSEDVASAVLFLCSDEARFINGSSITLDGGQTTQDQFVLAHHLSSLNSPTR